jgi:glycosyltransferase involved in cell wall biosynthesis
MEHCVDTLLQGGDDIEIILVNDGSTKDNTAEISARYAAQYPDIVRAIHQENGGHGEGINQGLDWASGKYFKVVDSDDALSEDFPLFLDKLEECDKAGGVDLMVTNYFYVHTDGVGDRSICYKGNLPVGRIFTWSETRPFKLHQMLTIHSCTFRTELMRETATKPLPKHVFYEDNLMICRVLPHVRKMYYMNIDMYRYWIGRPDQSVQEEVMKKRYTHQLLVTERCFRTCRLDEIEERRLRKYMKHEFFVMFGISILYARLNKSDEADQNLDKMWQTCIDHDEKWGKHFRYFTPLALICLPGKFGRDFGVFIYRLANKIVRFN